MGIKRWGNKVGKSQVNTVITVFDAAVRKLCIREEKDIEKGSLYVHNMQKFRSRGKKTVHIYNVACL